MENKQDAVAQFQIGEAPPDPLEKIVAQPGWHWLQFKWIYSPEHDYEPEGGGEKVHIDEHYAIRLTGARSDKTLFYALGLIATKGPSEEIERALYAIENLALSFETYRNCSCKLGAPCVEHQ